ncbi:hypothetical protein IRW67_004613, partial [Salmonella enterica]|nr:hypothetical protein [Salmonella enterica]
IFQMEIQSPYEKGKSLDAYEQAAIEQYTSTVSDIAASAQSAPAEPEVAEASAKK